METTNSTPKRIIVGITGASGVVYGIRALELLAEAGIETHLVISKAAELTMTYETDIRATDLRALASRWYSPGDIGAAISSGSFKTKGMIFGFDRFRFYTLIDRVGPRADVRRDVLPEGRRGLGAVARGVLRGVGRAFGYIRDYARLRMRADRIEFGGRQARVRHQGLGVEFRGGEEQHDLRDAVLGDDHHAVAAAHAPVAQQVGGSVDGLAQLARGQPVRVFDQRDVVGVVRAGSVRNSAGISIEERAAKSELNAVSRSPGLQ
ncbi:MAG: Flavin prenyltransferase UbiX [uncultured Paraburkholderia sp.]|nr:MAG: Flavin prenyltransferase UbiX [uncultured Paraburkholderia sp.]CAH2925788.1 MAG: Flavin prenyltransferase UbiX [uncultured Paraburkholderia sp.]